MTCPACGATDGDMHLPGCEAVAELLDPMVKITRLERQVATLTVEKEKLLTAWGKMKEDTMKVVLMIDSMKIEFSKLAIQRDEWRQIAAKYRTMVSTHPLSQGEDDASHDRTAGRPP